MLTINNLGVKTRTFFHALNYHIARKRVPILLSLSVTNRCNLRCPFCYANVFNRRIKDLPTETLLRIIDDFIDLGTQGIMLQGGEPLMRKDIGILIRHITERGRFCSLTTNGVFMRNNLDKLRDLDRLEISFDGTKEIVDKNRGPGVYEKILESLDLLHQNNIKFCLHSVITNSTTSDNTLMPILKIAGKYNTYATFCTVTGTSEDVEPNKYGLELDINKVKENYRHLINLKKQGYPVGNSFSVLQHTLDWPLHLSKIVYEDEEGKYPLKGPRCVYGRLSVYLDADGNLYPCAKSFHKKGFSENIFEDGGVKGAWERMAKLKCIHCGESAEGTYLFALKLEDVLNAVKY